MTYVDGFVAAVPTANREKYSKHAEAASVVRPAGLHGYRAGRQPGQPARRLCKPLGRSVLVSGAVAAQTTTALIPLGERVLRGITEPCAVFTLPED